MEKDDRAESDHSSKEPPAKKALFGEEHEFVQHGRSQRQKEERLYCKKVLNICIIFYKGLSNLFWGQYNEVHVDLYINELVNGSLWLLLGRM